ncbi:unnamed protein product [Vitrella brassicaformis CCMP3155]|uniref:EF-hand domain-containing protein n=1 Tax=Vitrella brassicaformis (strain CCMP3155) TaxID=1169540 RepID=A0A0G4FEX6_VITBC|nr:unnamed protein product [Vitrella brassicaformis CCMP3155]|mmetsp:Transcript_4828/g.11210  ORF Transcript_4828/g.11210 Transcript_4828/m.11210 type:complete len:612 (-) Transcript_4828:152-1987(-)|eukprot:CEM11795.1 unnamed protein product [Vitrella brassicaformis CCMP3155]
MDLSPRERLHRFKTHPSSIATVLCSALKEHDKHHRGLVSASAFSRTLHNLGLKFGSAEVDGIMEQCVVTEDGYVHYKPLLDAVRPEKPMAARSSARDAISPVYLDEADVFDRTSPPLQGCAPPDLDMTHPAAIRFLVAAKSPDIRKIFAVWDRGAIDDATFRAKVEELGVPVTQEFDRLLTIYGPSRALSYGKVMAALQINDVTERKTRSNAADVVGQPSPPRYRPQTSFKDPITWQNDTYFQNLKSGRRIYNKAMLQPSPRVPYGVKDQSPIPSAADHEAVTKRVADFVDGVISAIVFRTELQRLGVTVTPPLEQLIRQHDLHQSVPFRDFMRVLTKPGAEIEGGEASAAGLEPGEGAGPGGAKLMPASAPTKIDPSQMPACGGKTPKNAFDSTENILSWGVRGEGEEVGVTAPRTTKGEGYRPPPFAIDQGQQQVGEEGGCATTGRRHALHHYRPPPFAIEGHDGLPQAPGTSSPPPGSAGKEWTSRAMQNYGDIIGWTAQPTRPDIVSAPTRALDDKAKAPRGQYVWQRSSDIISWGNEDPGVFSRGRRRFLPLGEECPFGTDADVARRDVPPAAAAAASDLERLGAEVGEEANDIGDGQGGAVVESA